ncbi:MAG: hypothetical protein ABIG37_03915 [Nanoarchaeota archaeon]|nr:hypothetical protein [Nanoarchaeota archaeon]
MDRLIQEKISADHLLHVSMKYTKTTGVMLNLIERWRSMIEISIDLLLERAKKKKSIKIIPLVPKLKVEKIKEIHKKNPFILEGIGLYDFFKRIDKMEKTSEGEFRKNVALKVLDKGKWVNINMEQLKEYSEIVERYMINVKQVLN